MAGQRQKPPDQLAFQRGGRGRGLVVAAPGLRRVPPMPFAPAGVVWSKRTRAAWRALWKSHVSAAIDLNADGERLRTWMRAIHDREQLLDRIREEGHVVPWGRGGALVAHPSLRWVKHLDGEIARISADFGLTPLSRFRLQVTFSEAGQAEDALAQLRARREQERLARPQQTSARIIDLDGA